MQFFRELGRLEQNKKTATRCGFFYREKVAELFR